MIRFSEGVPQAIWYSQHASGQAFTYGATEKNGKRPVVYSGNGTHANYAIPGYIFPCLFSVLDNVRLRFDSGNTITLFPASISLMD